MFWWDGGGGGEWDLHSGFRAHGVCEGGCELMGKARKSPEGGLRLLKSLGVSGDCEGRGMVMAGSGVEKAQHLSLSELLTTVRGGQVGIDQCLLTVFCQQMLFRRRDNPETPRQRHLPCEVSKYDAG